MRKKSEPASNPTYCSNGLKQRLNWEEPVYRGMPLSQIVNSQPTSSLRSPPSLSPSDSLDRLTYQDQQNPHCQKHNPMQKKSEARSPEKAPASAADPVSVVRTKSTVGEAGRLICQSQLHHRDNHLDDYLKYYNVSQQSPTAYPYHFDKDLHMKSKLGYANEKAIHRDMRNHTDAVLHPLMQMMQQPSGKYLKNMHEITF